MEEHKVGKTGWIMGHLWKRREYRKMGQSQREKIGLDSAGNGRPMEKNKIVVVATAILSKCLHACGSLNVLGILTQSTLRETQLCPFYR